jgi:hypothetical protein
MAVGHETIGPAVVVEVREGAAPTDPEYAIVIQAAGSSLVFEETLSLIDEEGNSLVPEVGNKQVSPTVAIDVLGVDSHSRAPLSFRSIAGPRGFRDILERAIPSIEKDKVGTHVIGDIDIDPAVVIKVDGGDPETAAISAGDACCYSHVGEGVVSVVSVEDVAGGPN